jgi:hypothetical protein
MENGIYFKMGVDERIEIKFKSGFEGGAVSAEVEGNGIDGGHTFNFQLSIFNLQ